MLANAIKTKIILQTPIEIINYGKVVEPHASDIKKMKEQEKQENEK